MATDTHLDRTKGRPLVKIKCGYPQRYSYKLILWKGNQSQRILKGRFDHQNEASDSVIIQHDAANLVGYSLSWEIYVKVPGGGSGQYAVRIEVEQDGDVVPGGLFTAGGPISNTALVADITDFVVS